MLAETHSCRELVLVVDDSPDTLGLLTDALEEVGLTVLVSPSGEHALRLLERITPDVILMDAVMPGLDGFETCRQLKARHQLYQVPVIFMTGLSATDDIVRGLEAGGVDYLTKPINPKEMITRMRVHLANARVTQNSQAALDQSRRYLFAVDRQGQVLWSTPQAMRILNSGIASLSGDGQSLAPDVRRWLLGQQDLTDNRQRYDLTLKLGDNRRLELSLLSPAGGSELLLRISEHDSATDLARLVDFFALTQREAEVALWLAQGKSNKEIGDILGVSPRTVNKHLELVFNKLDVDNRTAAAARLVRYLAES